ncbi:DUF502 domain-containing protein [Melioribacter sp. Ez-97]|uniref:DUF502 domain-containing protein n=1 Tax=Melioribacter sp. Ez-97 TaxID=3423434 RepID=UPI003ED87A29
MERLKAFLRTTFLGGFLIVLPIILLIFVLDWFFNFLTDKIRPVTNILVETARLNELVASVAAVIIILLLFFIVGLIVRTSLGSYIIGFLEEKILRRVPLYKIIKDTVIHLFGDEKLIFKGVALVKPFGNDTMVTAFITDESFDGYTTVFIPSAPAPTGGYIYHIKNEFVIKLDYPVEEAMRTVLSLGGGSGKLLNTMNEKKS